MATRTGMAIIIWHENRNRYTAWEQEWKYILELGTRTRIGVRHRNRNRECEQEQVYGIGTGTGNWNRNRYTYGNRNGNILMEREREYVYMDRNRYTVWNQIQEEGMRMGTRIRNMDKKKGIGTSARDGNGNRYREHCQEGLL